MTTWRLRKHRPSQRLLAVLLAATVGIAAACSSDDEPANQGDTVTDTGNIDASDMTDEQLADVLSSLGGETVDDTDIVFNRTNATISLGGIPITLDTLRDYTELTSSVTIPPTWPVLNLISLTHETESGPPLMAWVVLRQNELVTDDTSRAALLSDYWRLARFEDADTVHQSTTLDPDTGIICITEVRLGVVRNFDPKHEAVVMFAGPGIASSAVSIVIFDESPEALTIVGDIVEQACSTRPDGL